MNILIYVSTLLMLLAIMTYARVENFRSTAGFEYGFVHRIGMEQQEVLSNKAEAWYGRLRPNSHANCRDESANPLAGSRLSVHLLLNEKKRDNHPEEYKATRALLKQLLVELYAKEQFFQEIAIKQPNFLDSILNDIQSSASMLPKEQTITNATAMLNLKINDQELHSIFVKMMHGLPKLENVDMETEKRSNILQPIEYTEKLDIDDEGQVAVETSETHAPSGYVSLLDFITTRPTLKVRVFLASEPLLMAIYGDPQLVESIIEKRQEYYKTLKAHKEDDKKVKADLTNQFKQEFEQKGNAGEYSKILDYTVTRTNPKDYK